MNRRKFISSGAKLVAGAALGSLTPGCFFDDPVHQNSIWTYCEDTDRTGPSSGKYCTPLNNGITWSNHRLVVPLNASGTGWDVTSAENPNVIKDGNLYRMWYTGFVSPNWALLYCESLDGINWFNHQIAMTPGASGTGFDTLGVGFVTVMKEASVYRIWISMRDASIWRIVYAESSDGYTWSNYQQALTILSQGTFDSLHVFYPSVIKDGSVYKMWYTGHNGNQRIIYCDSVDGINWQNFTLSVDIAASGLGFDNIHSTLPCVIRDNSSYKMWYSGGFGAGGRIIYCESQDGISWSNFQLSIDINSSGTGVDSSSVGNSSVINENGVGKVWYSAATATIAGQILYAESF